VRNVIENKTYRWKTGSWTFSPECLTIITFLMVPEPMKYAREWQTVLSVRDWDFRKPVTVVFCGGVRFVNYPQFNFTHTDTRFWGSC